MTRESKMPVVSKSIFRNIPAEIASRAASSGIPIRIECAKQFNQDQGVVISASAARDLWSLILDSAELKRSSMPTATVSWLNDGKLTFDGNGGIDCYFSVLEEGMVAWLTRGVL